MSAQADDTQIAEGMEDIEMDDPMDGDADENGEEGEDQVPEFVKREFVARPYTSEFNTDKEIEDEKVVNSR